LGIKYYCITKGLWSQAILRCGNNEELGVVGARHCYPNLLPVEQNAYMVLHIAAKGYILGNGKILLSGTAAELLENKEISKAYLGAL